MERLFGTAGFPWWWHTREDTIDKIDADVLALDTRVYVAAALRLVGAPLLPLDHGARSRARSRRPWRSSAAAGGRWDAGAGARGRPRTSPSGPRRSRGPWSVARRRAGDAARAEAANRALVRLSRVLIPLFYTTGDRFHHDLAIPRAAARGTPAGAGAVRPGPVVRRVPVRAAALVRERNRVVHALEAAAG